MPCHLFCPDFDDIYWKFSELTCMDYPFTPSFHRFAFIQLLAHAVIASDIFVRFSPKRRIKTPSRLWVTSMGLYFCGYELFGEFDCLGFTQQIDLDLTWILQLVLDLLCDIACQQDHLVLADNLGFDHDTNLTACLNGK